MVPNVSSRMPNNPFVVDMARNKVQNFVARADILAQDVLSEQYAKTEDRPHVVHHYHSYWVTPGWGWGWGWNPFFYPRPNVTVINVHPSGDGRGKKEDNTASVVLGVLALVVAGVAAYATGAAISRYSDAKKELQTTEEFTREFPQHMQNLDERDRDIVQKANEILPLQRGLCERIKNLSTLSLAFRATLFVGSVVTAIGCFAPLAAATASALITAGVAAGLFATFAMLFQWGYESISKNNVADAQQIHNIVHRQPLRETVIAA